MRGKFDPHSKHVLKSPGNEIVNDYVIETSWVMCINQFTGCFFSCFLRTSSYEGEQIHLSFRGICGEVHVSVHEICWGNYGCILED